MVKLGWRYSGLPRALAPCCQSCRCYSAGLRYPPEPAPKQHSGRFTGSEDQDIAWDGDIAQPNAMTGLGAFVEFSAFL